jgi:hypothetical protein
METSNFDRFATMFVQTTSRRRALHLLGVAAVGAGSLSVIGTQSGLAKKRRRNKHKNQQQDTPEQPQQPQDPPAPNITIQSITVSPLAEAGHDNVVIEYRNIGTAAASGFRIGIVAVRQDGTVRNEVFSLPLTLAPGATATEAFRLGCAWLNNGTITARTDPSPVPGESATLTADNTLSQTFGAAVCS